MGPLSNSDSNKGYKSAILDVDCNDARRVLDTNLWGVIEVTQAFMPMLLITKGTVVNIGSISGKIPLLFQGIYGMSKAALDHLSKQMRLELRPLGIEVIHVWPVPIRAAPASHGTAFNSTLGGGRSNQNGLLR